MSLNLTRPGAIIANTPEPQRTNNDVIKLVREAFNSLIGVT